jgi:hypothetical protein
MEIECIDNQVFGETCTSKNGLQKWLRRNIVIHGDVFTFSHPNLLIQESAAFLQAYNTVEAHVGGHAIHYKTKLTLK